MSELRAHLSLPSGNGPGVCSRGNGKCDRCERRQFRDETIASYKGWAVVAVAAAVAADDVEGEGARSNVACNRRHKLTIAQTTATSAGDGRSRVLSRTGVYFASTFVVSRTRVLAAVTTGRNSYLRGRVKRGYFVRPGYPNVFSPRRREKSGRVGRPARWQRYYTFA